MLYHHTTTMIYFMLDDLGCPAGVFAMLFPEIAIQVIHFYLVQGLTPSSDRHPSSVWYGRSFFVITGLIMAN